MVGTVADIANDAEEGFFTRGSNVGILRFYGIFSRWMEIACRSIIKM